jgi:hypothetical protein
MPVTTRGSLRFRLEFATPEKLSDEAVQTYLLGFARGFIDGSGGIVRLGELGEARLLPFRLSDLVIDKGD